MLAGFGLAGPSKLLAQRTRRFQSRNSLGLMKQYKLTAWPDLPSRYRSTAMRRVVSEMTQRFATPRDLARKCGASTREIEELLSTLTKDGVLMSREAPRTLRPNTPWREWTPVAVVRGLVRTIRRQEAR
jgi:hypothetical protein